MSSHNELGHGYALNVHKAQGVTVGYAHVWATPEMDRQATYLAMIRYRQGLSVHAHKANFEPRGSLSQARPKGMAMDFAAAHKERQAHSCEERAGGENRLLSTREGLQAADAAAQSEVMRLRLAAEQPILALDQTVQSTSAYLEAQRHLQAEAHTLARWQHLRQQTVA